jgi:uncharacterized damage-inducible protein DinB
VSAATLNSPQRVGLIEAYVAGVESFATALRGLGPAELRARPVPGMWSILEVACHVADSEGLFAERMKRVLAEDRPPLAWSDQEACVTALAYDAREVTDELECVAALRRQMARILQAQPDDKWSRVGIHSLDGEQTLEQLLRKAVNHLEHHVRCILEKRRILS